MFSLNSLSSSEVVADSHDCEIGDWRLVEDTYGTSVEYSLKEPSRTPDVRRACPRRRLARTPGAEFKLVDERCGRVNGASLSLVSSCVIAMLTFYACRLSLHRSSVFFIKLPKATHIKLKPTRKAVFVFVVGAAC